MDIPCKPTKLERHNSSGPRYLVLLRVLVQWHLLLVSPHSCRPWFLILAPGPGNPVGQVSRPNLDKSRFRTHFGVFKFSTKFSSWNAPHCSRMSLKVCINANVWRSVGPSQIRNSKNRLEYSEFVVVSPIRQRVSLGPSLRERVFDGMLS